MTRRRVLATVAVVALVVTSGCGMLSNSEPTPPGLSESEITDAGELVRSHTNELQSQSFTLQSTRTVEMENKDYRIVSEYTYRVDPSDPFRAVMHVDRSVRGNASDDVPPVRDLSMWRRGDTTYVRISTPNGSRYDSLDLINSSMTINDVTSRQKVARLFERKDATVEEVTRNGETYVRVDATINASDPVKSSNMTLFVSESGVVERMTASRQVEFRSASQSITTTVEFLHLGETTVEKPDWVAAAKNQTASR